MNQTMMEIRQEFNPLAIGFESLLFQRTLAIQLKDFLASQGIYIPIHEIEDRRHKQQKIQDELGVLSYQQRLVVSRSCTKFLSQYINYPGVDHDDSLDSTSTAIITAKRLFAGYHLLPINPQAIYDEPEDIPNYDPYQRLIEAEKRYKRPNTRSGLAP
jgi:hypothetical protein